ncbi:MAG: cysteine--tRNA ligase, partial [Lysobacteraceae bacterium]
LQFPHHDNEVAQSECRHKHADGAHKAFARWWLHNGMLNFGGSKMAKSVGNIQRVHDLVREHPPEALRYALLSAHYRQPLEWSDGLIEQSIKRLDRLYRTLKTLSNFDATPRIPKSIETALNNDLNTPQALAEIAHIESKAKGLFGPPGGPTAELTPEIIAKLCDVKSELLGAGLALGLQQQPPETWFARGASSDDDTRIQALVDERNVAKKVRDFARADEIRKRLADEGIVLEDTPQGVVWRRA